ncbi:MAG: response regulator [Candidatus Omnitrophota bacterium]|nr:response regulator [Candidatus Omnitrophota bacterium]MBU1928928.1 response regulator [Candidatus Omnitrophota bacterium]MBU2035347.1 response regulator [Candidatus Omnitrophota bacterium]MBU2221345.1 response regulator [Candidatus Omnitrophota bacterium]
MNKKIVLIIDDEENFCKLVKKNIEKTGEYEVHIATNGEDGIKLAREIKPDLLLLDVVMPGMDGSDVASKIRDDQSIEDTPIVFLTAIVREEESSSQPSFTRGYSLLAKTVSVTELMACIKENVRRCPRP